MKTRLAGGVGIILWFESNSDVRFLFGQLVKELILHKTSSSRCGTTMINEDV